jgi:hypothetical protein
MSNVIAKPTAPRSPKPQWDVRRDISLERLCMIWESLQMGEGSDDVPPLLDLITVAHLSGLFGFHERISEEPWQESENLVIERVVSAFRKYQAGEDPEDLIAALNALSVMHAATVFEALGGPLKW